MDGQTTHSRDIIVIGPTPPPYNGVSVMTRQLLDAAAASGRRVVHLDTRDERPVVTMGRFDFQNVALGLKHALQFAGLLLRAPRAAVYVPISQSRWGFVRDAVFLIGARLAGRPRYVHLHGGYFGEFVRRSGSAFRLLARFALAGAEQAWVLTPGLAHNFRDLVPDDRVRVLENAIDDLPAANGRAHPDELTILYLSNLVPEKGCFALVDALERLGERLSGTRVVFAGDAFPGVREQIEQRARGLADQGIRIDLTGPVAGQAKLDLLRDADLFAYPTAYTYEGQPLVLLEAMAAGLPIVTTRHAGIPDTVRDGSEGLLVETGDTDALADALARLAGDAELRDRLGRAARARYEDRYAPARFRRDVAELLG
jgi:glycosyltransferase involved in cell wall biosynthesis